MRPPINRRMFAALTAMLALPSMPAAANEPDVKAYTALIEQIVEITNRSPDWLKWALFPRAMAITEPYTFERTDTGIVMVPSIELRRLLLALRAGNGEQITWE